MKEELEKSFSPKDIEGKWYQFWESKGYYKIGLDLKNPKSFNSATPSECYWNPSHGARI